MAQVGIRTGTRGRPEYPDGTIIVDERGNKRIKYKGKWVALPKKKKGYVK